MSEPFNENEKKAWLALGEAMKHFLRLEQTHPSHTKDFVDAIHKAQDILGSRVLQRTYPKSWAYL